MTQSGDADPRLRVAIVYHYFAHYRTPILLDLLNNSVHDFVFVGDTVDCFDSGIKVWYPNESGKFYRIHSRAVTSYRLVVQPQVFRAIYSLRTDCVIFLGNPKFVTTWLASLFAKCLGKKVLFWTHGWYQPEKSIKRFILNRFYSLADALLLYGNYAKEIGTLEGFDPEKIYVIYNSLDTEQQEKVRNTLSTKQRNSGQRLDSQSVDTPYIICAGRLQPNKKFEMVIAAASLLKQQKTTVNLLFVGDGPDRENLTKLAAEAGVNATFYGECYDEQVLGEFFSGASVTVSPGNVGLTAMHSLAYGTPVVSHKNLANQMPEAEAIIDGITGSLFIEDDCADLAAKIKLWLQKDLHEMEKAQRECLKMIRTYYNPKFQRLEIDKAVSGFAPTQNGILTTFLSE